MNKGSRIMRLFVLFDMPVETSVERREYNRFRKKLLKDGFLMLQYSVYVRFCNNDTDADQHVKRVLSFNPKYGDVRILKITENQYENMILVSGEKKIHEMYNLKDQLIII